VRLEKIKKVKQERNIYENPSTILFCINAATNEWSANVNAIDLTYTEEFQEHNSWNSSDFFAAFCNFRILNLLDGGRGLK